MQLGNLIVNCLLLKLYRKPRKYISVTKIYMQTFDTTVKLAFRAQYVFVACMWPGMSILIVWPSLYHLRSLGSSMVGASHRTSEGCGIDSNLGITNIFLGLRLSLSSKQFPTAKVIQIDVTFLYTRRTNVSLFKSRIHFPRDFWNYSNSHEKRVNMLAYANTSATFSQ